MLVPALLAIMLHEVAHGYIAERFGDPTARLLGRLNLNPFKHIDPIGTIAIFVVGFGWARPVPVNPKNFRRPHRDMIWVSLAGPGANFLLALLSALLLRGLGWLDSLALDSLNSYRAVTQPVEMMLAFSLYVNTLLGIFNLVPIPPLDGGRILIGILPERQAMLISRLEPFGFMLLIALIFLTDIWSVVLSPIIYYIVNLLSGPQITIVQHAMKFLFGN